MLKESLRMSWQNIRANKMRSFLTILALSSALRHHRVDHHGGERHPEMTRQFSELGAGKVSISGQRHSAEKRPYRG